MTTSVLQARPAMQGTSLALSNLRGVVIIIVLAFHSMLAYLDWLPAKPIPFNVPPYLWQAFPVIDQQRWFGFDLFCAWQDVCLMSMMFFLSGLFVWSSLRRKGGWRFLSDRLWRIGLPSGLILVFAMPLTYYPTYHLSAANPSIAGFWQEWFALPFWPCGHLWFIWQLLAMNVLVAALHGMLPRWGEWIGSRPLLGGTRPTVFLAGLAVASAIAYIPLAYAFTPWAWTHFGPVGFQICRPLHYVVFFAAGAAVGAYGLERGLAAVDGPLARRWLPWGAAALVTFGLWGWLTGITLENGDRTALPIQLGSHLGFVLSCATGCLFMLALFLRFAARMRWRVLDSLSENAYGMYLVHYVFVIWLQFALVQVALPAFGKVAIVLGISLIASWALAAALSGMAVGGRLVGARR